MTYNDILNALFESTVLPPSKTLSSASDLFEPNESHPFDWAVDDGVDRARPMLERHLTRFARHSAGTAAPPKAAPSLACRRSRRSKRQIAGNTNSVSSVAVIRPPMTTVANGF